MPMGPDAMAWGHFDGERARTLFQLLERITDGIANHFTAKIQYIAGICI